MFRRLPKFLVVAAAMAMLALALRSGQAATYHIGLNAPEPPAGETRYDNLQALYDAHQTLNNDTLIFYDELDDSLTSHGTAFQVSGTVNVRSSVPGEERIISGNGIGGRIFDINSGTTTIGSEFVFEQINSSASGTMAVFGYSAVLNVDGVTYRYNRSASFGGAIDTYGGSTQWINARGAAFHNNVGSRGGGVELYLMRGGDFTNADFYDNTATSQPGGAIIALLSASTPMEIILGATDGETSTFRGNAYTGGGYSLANSLYITESGTVNINIVTEGDGVLDLIDPIYLTPGSNHTPTFTKTGTGTCKIDGDTQINTGTGRTTISIEEGILSMYRGAEVHMTGDNDSFRLSADAEIQINGANVIEGTTVTFNPDSILTFNMDYFFDSGQRDPIREDDYLLFLDGTTLTVAGTLVNIVFPNDPDNPDYVDPEDRKGEYILIQGANELQRGDFYLTVNGRKIASKRYGAYLDDTYKGVQDASTLVLHVAEDVGNTVLLWDNNDGNNLWSVGDRNFYDAFALAGENDSFLPNDTVIFGGPGSTDGGTITLIDDAIISKDNNGYVSGDQARGMYVGDGDWIFRGGSIGDAYAVDPSADYETGPNFLAALIFDGNGTLRLDNTRPNTYHDGTVISGGGTMTVRGAEWLGSTEFIGAPTTGRVVQNSGYGIEFRAAGGHLHFQYGTDPDGTGRLQQRIGVGSTGTLRVANGELLITADTRYQLYAPDKRGGAVHVENSGRLTLLGQYVFLENRSQEDGGAIYAGTGTTVDLSGVEEGLTTATVFGGNAAAGHGGAIAIEGGSGANSRSALISRNAAYVANEAGGQGGALYLTNTTTDISGSVFGGVQITEEGIFVLANVAGDEGGAVYYSNVAGSVLEADATVFYGNEGSSGGALFVASRTTVNADQSSFDYNWAISGSGGAVALTGERSTLNVNGSAFRDNTAEQNGGAVSAAANNVTINANDGASFVENTAGGSGGAVYADANAIVNINNGAVVSRNIASGSGGAIYLGDNAVLSIDQARVTNNEAMSGDGGAVRVGDASTVSAVGTSFSNNEALTGSGGAIAMLGTSRAENVLDVSLARFNNSVAGGSGGAVYAANTAKIIADGAAFTGNEAAIDGGALYLLNADALDLRNASLVNNTAGEKGGGVYFARDIEGEAAILLGSDGTLSQFSNNTSGASRLASSIYFDVSALTELDITIDGSGIVDMADPFVVDSVGNEVGISITKTGSGAWQLGGVNDFRHTAEAATVDIEGGTFQLNRNAALLLTHSDGEDHFTMLEKTRLAAVGNNRIETSALEIATGTTMTLDGSLALNIGSDYSIGSVLSGRGDFTKQDDKELTFNGKTTDYSGSVSILGGTFDLQRSDDVEGSGQFQTTGNFTMAPGTTLRVIAEGGQPAVIAGTMNINQSNLVVSELSLGHLASLASDQDLRTQNIVLLRTTQGITGDFNSVGVGDHDAAEVDYLTYNLGFLDAEHKEYGGTIGLRWYSTTLERPAHGTFTLHDNARFRLGVPLHDNPGDPNDFDLNWNGKSLTKDGTGTLILAAENRYTGTTTVNGGELVLEHASATGTGSALVTVNSLGSLVLDFDGTYEKSVNGDGKLVKRGSGTVNLAGANTYRGGTVLEDGVLGIAGMTNIGDGTILFTGGTLRNNAAIANFNGNLQAGAGRDVRLDTPFDLTVSTPISDSGDGNGGLIKSGAGTLTLTARNTYSGDTRVWDGTLKLDGSVRGDVYAEYNGAVGGNGRIRVTEIIDEDRNVTERIGGNLFINPGGAYDWFFNATHADSLTVDGSVTLHEGSILRPRTANEEIDFTRAVSEWTIMEYGVSRHGEFTYIDNRYSAFFEFDLADLDYSSGAIRISGNLLSSPKTLSDSVTTSLVMANRRMYRQAFAQMSREAAYGVHVPTAVRGQAASTQTRSTWFTPTIRANRYASSYHVNDPYWFESYGMQAGGTLWSNRHNTLGVSLGYERGLLRNHSDSVRSHDYTLGVYNGHVFSDHYEIRSFLGTGFQNFTSFRNDGEHSYEASYKGASVMGNIELSRPDVSLKGRLLRRFVALDFEYAHIETGTENEVGNQFRQYPRSSMTQIFGRVGAEVERRWSNVDLYGGAALRCLLLGPVRPEGKIFYPVRGAGARQRGAKMGTSSITFNTGFNWHLDEKRSTVFFFDYYADIFFDSDAGGAMHTGNAGLVFRF